MAAENRPVVSAIQYGEDGTAISVASDGSVASVTRGVDPSFFSGVREGYLTTTSTATSLVRASLWSDPGNGAQRSVVSSSTADAAAGTGARTIRVVYYRSDGTGPFTEDKTMNGTTGVAFTETDLRFVERMEVLTVGSNGAPVGNVDVVANNDGTGAVLGRLNVGENTTLWAQHWVPPGAVMNITDVVAGVRSTGGAGTGSSGRVMCRQQALLTANSAVRDVIFGMHLQQDTSTTSVVVPQSPIRVAGPTMVTLWVRADSSSSSQWFVGFSFYDSV